MGDADPAMRDADSWLPTQRLLHACPHGRDGATGVVLVLCGSFSPPTVAHLQIVGMGKAAVERLGTVAFAGAYISPVHDSYGKPGLASGKHRLAMCELAASSKSTGLPGIESAAADYRLAACGWECAQSELTRTLKVLRVATLLAQLHVRAPCPPWAPLGSVSRCQGPPARRGVRWNRSGPTQNRGTHENPSMRANREGVISRQLDNSE